LRRFEEMKNATEFVSWAGVPSSENVWTGKLTIVCLSGYYLLFES
jgi:hypothetical protein